MRVVELNVEEEGLGTGYRRVIGRKRSNDACAVILARFTEIKYMHTNALTHTKHTHATIPTSSTLGCESNKQQTAIKGNIG